MYNDIIQAWVQVNRVELPKATSPKSMVHKIYQLMSAPTIL